MTNIEQKALELVNAFSVTDGYKDILRVPNSFLAKVLYHALETHEADKSRHAAEMREQAERFSEAVEQLEVIPDELVPFILAPVDPLVEALEATGDDQAKERAWRLHGQLAERGFEITPIVKKEAVNG